MNIKLRRARNFIVMFSLSTLAAWLVLPRVIRRAIQPTAFAAAATFTVNVNGDAHDANPGDGICQTSVPGNCSLRAAIEEANANSGKDTINFNIPGPGVHTISPGSALPNITDSVVIDAYSQPGSSQNTLSNGENAILLIELNGAGAGQLVNGLLFLSADNLVQGLVINRFSANGIVSNSSTTTIQGNYLGTNSAGNVSFGNLDFGINVGSNNNIIGGTTPAARNVISGNGGTNGGGIAISNASGNVVQGNFIGTDASGTAALGNLGIGGVILGSNGSENTIGGTSPGARNIISGNQGNGVSIFASSNQVSGNYIGTNVNGNAALPNTLSGVSLAGGGLNFPLDNVIGGASVEARNVISGNSGSGVEIVGSSSNNEVLGNYIGTDASGSAALANAVDGVRLASGPNAIIGGPTVGNVISGNGKRGIEITDSTHFTKVRNNFIGTDAGGTRGLGNTLAGILINNDSTNNTIGGPAFGNIIAFNGNNGIRITGAASQENDILDNSIFSNGDLGIDLGGDGVTANDALGHNGPNKFQNFPVITAANTNGSTTTINGSLDSIPNFTFTIQFFANPTCDPSGFGEGQVLVGTITRTTGGGGHANFGPAIVSAVPAGQFLTATATEPSHNSGGGANTSEFSQCVQVTGTSPSPTPTPTPTPTLTTVQFGQSSYFTFEDCIGITITVARLGDTSGSATVDYATQAGTASDRSDFNTAASTLRFAPGETAKSFEVLITEDSFSEGPESFTVALSNPSGALLGSPSSVPVQIIDDVPEPSANPIDSTDDFVCQHYHDFLNREEDSNGAAFWNSEITVCGNNAACIQQKRINTSASFFLSIEFQETGGFAIRVQRAAFGRKSVDPATRISYAQFIRDGRFVGEGVVVGQLGWDARLEANKQAYINQVVASTPFTTTYGSGLTAAQFVDALFASAGVTPAATERQDAINAFAGGGLAGRAAALRSVSDSNSLRGAEFLSSFVLMQYFGYLRRNPTDAPDNNDSGYQFWLAKLNAFNGDFVQAEMVKAFITSFEYRSRFGQP